MFISNEHFNIIKSQLTFISKDILVKIKLVVFFFLVNCTHKITYKKKKKEILSGLRTTC